MFNRKFRDILHEYREAIVSLQRVNTDIMAELLEQRKEAAIQEAIPNIVIQPNDGVLSVRSNIGSGANIRMNTGDIIQLKIQMHGCPDRVVLIKLQDRYTDETMPKDPGHDNPDLFGCVGGPYPEFTLWRDRLWERLRAGAR